MTAEINCLRMAKLSQNLICVLAHGSSEVLNRCNISSTSASYGNFMCEEQARLTEAYDKAVSSFSMALDALQAAIRTTPKEEYNRLRHYVELARVFSEQTRIDLERHIHEHGCASA